MAQEMKGDVMENIQVTVLCVGGWCALYDAWCTFQAYLATQAQLQLMEDHTPSKTLRSREGMQLCMCSPLPSSSLSVQLLPPARHIFYEL